MAMDGLLSGLNPAQRRAVETTEGPVLVLAGAGSGKTRVITRRIAWLIARELARPSEILAVTFTNKAAAEMRERVAELTGSAFAKEIVISTFHAFCLSVLRRDIERLGYRKNFTIYSESDARALLRRVTDELSDRQARFSPAIFHSAISLRKNAGETPETLRARPLRNATEEKYEARLGDVYERYQSGLRAANSLDFDDLLLCTLQLWRRHPEAIAEARARFRYVLVDEYQDTNRLQYELLTLLTEEHHNLCVVGDDDQSIYGWRGAEARHILNFEKDFPEATIITLDQNYRSTETILKAANSVIANNSTRRHKQLWSSLGKGRALEWFVTANEEAEAREAARWIRHIMRRTGARYGDFAVLYRSNMQSRPFELAFRQAGIPYVVIGGQDFFERAEVKDVVSYLKICANPRDESAFLRVVNMPRRGIGDAVLHQAHDICRLERCSLGKALAKMIEHGSAPMRSAQGIREFLALLQRFRARFKRPDAPLRKIVEELIIAIDYAGELERMSKNREQAMARLDNIEVVLQAVEQYEKEAQTPSLSGFLDQTHLDADPIRERKENNGNTKARLMTIHSAKGLEFPFVFIVGVEEGLLPHEQSVKEGNLEEERRLFYVALTRGRRHVSLFEALSRTRNGRECPRKTSPFVKEIPADLLKRRVCAVSDGMAAGSDARIKL